MTTKAIVMTETGGPDVLKLREIPMPLPKKGEVRVAVKAIGVNPVETYWRSGTAGRNPKLPYTPGRDAAGVVDAVGAGVTKVKVGDRVFSTGAVTGAYAYHFIVGETDVHILPASASFESGACLGTPAMAAYRALFTRGQAKSGENLFIHGASGGVGLVAVQLAKSHGMTVTGTADNETGVELLKSIGCDHAYIHRENGYFEKVASHGPFDLIVEVLANVNLDKDLTVAAKKGRIVIIGSRGTVTINPRDIMTKELDVRGLFLTAQTEEEKMEAVAKLVSSLENQTLKPVVSERLSLEQAPTAHIHVIDPVGGARGKIIMTPSKL
eukprot:TRINITY_DN3024_c3_g1_i1.p1 TRINITY_DN3024_c3_g1~~TRINITY_DN3024_c3_g1_i1.p1  ORF type:complete len:339 (+),score=68.46 TRINITY_DN3024_c3_g1_i1:45-1019(+)